MAPFDLHFTNTFLLLYGCGQFALATLTALTDKIEAEEAGEAEMDVEPAV